GQDEAPAPPVRAQALYYEGNQFFGDVEIPRAVPEAPRVVLAVQLLRQLHALGGGGWSWDRRCPLADRRHRLPSSPRRPERRPVRPSSCTFFIGGPQQPG